ncbi:hypothetical protein LTR53_000581 [Teratosphaeriaceae sp. CCFEE 6253]|nr:hypothetical protein LTR53_000581 [Teratosphaeriaceae sp. CCFEE 6253]
MRRRSADSRQGMKDHGSRNTDIPCYPLSMVADFQPLSDRDLPPANCQIFNFVKHSCMELSDGREDGWNPNPADKIEDSIRGQTVTMHYNHNTATFYPTDQPTITPTTSTLSSASTGLVVSITVIANSTLSANNTQTSFMAVTVPYTSEEPSTITTYPSLTSQTGEASA